MNDKGIQCAVDSYHVIALAIIGGKPSQITFYMNERNVQAARERAAEQFGVETSKVLVDIELKKRMLTIDCTYDEFLNALGAADIPIKFEK